MGFDPILLNLIILIFTVEFNPTNKKSISIRSGVKNKQCYKLGPTKTKVKNDSPTWISVAWLAKSKGVPCTAFFFFFFGCIERKWGVSDPLENTSGQRWCLPRVKILGAVPLEEMFLLPDSTLLGNRARTLHLQTHLSHAYVDMSPFFLRYPTPILALFFFFFFSFFFFKIIS